MQLIAASVNWRPKEDYLPVALASYRLLKQPVAFVMQMVSCAPVGESSGSGSALRIASLT